MNPTSESSPEPTSQELLDDLGSVRMPQQKCLWCDRPLDAATDIEQEGNVPEEGDLSICLYCGNLAIYTAGEAGLVLRHPTVPERAEALADPQVRSALVHRALQERLR